MAFLSDLDKKITMLGQGALQKTKEVTDTAKMSSMIKTLETQKKENLEQLGKYYYDLYVQYGGELADPAAEIVVRIQQIEAQRNQLQEEVQKIKGTMFCPNCNTEIPANSQFCNVCGAKIERPVQEMQPQPSGRVCAQCGAPLEEDQVFCTNCGAKVEQPAEAAPQPEPVPAPAESANICPNCGKELRPEQKFCTSCGTKVG